MTLVLVLEEAEVRLLQELKSLLQGLDLLLTPGRALLPGHAAVDAHGLELQELVERVLQVLVLGLQVGVRLGDRELRVRLLAVLRVLERVLVADAGLRLGLEVLVGGLRILLIFLRSRDRVLEVGLNDLEEPDDRLGSVGLATVVGVRHRPRPLRRHVIDGLPVRPGTLGLVPLVPLSRRGRVLLALELDERAVEALEHLDRTLHRLEASLRVGERLVVRGLILLTKRGFFRETLGQIRNLLRQGRDVLRERVPECRLLHLQSRQRLNLTLRLVPALRGSLHLFVTPLLLARLGGSLVFQARNQVLDHLLHLGERARGLLELHEKRRQHDAVDLRRLTREETDHLLARSRRLRALKRNLEEAHDLPLEIVLGVVIGVLLATRLARRVLLLHEAEVIRRVHLRDVTLEELEILRNRRELLGARGGALVERLGLVLAFLGEVIKEVLVCILRVLRLLLFRLVLVDFLRKRGDLGALLREGLLESLELIPASSALHLILLAGCHLVVVCLDILLLEVLEQGLQRRDHLVRVVAVRGRSLLNEGSQLVRVVANLERIGHHDGVRDGLLVLRHQVDLRIGHASLGRRQGLDCTLHALDRGSQQLRRLHVRRVLLLADSVRLSLLILHIPNLLVEILDFRVERINSRGLALDLRSQDLDLLSELLDCVLLVVRLLLAEARVLVVALSLGLALLLDLGLDLLKQRDHLLHGVHFLLRASTECCHQQKK